MNLTQVIECLKKISAHNPEDCEGDLNTLFELNITETYKSIDLQHEDIILQLDGLREYNKDDKSNIWKYITLNSYLLKELQSQLDNSPPSDVLSVKQTQLLKDAIQSFVLIGICPNLQPKMPCYRKLPSNFNEETHTILHNYNILKSTTLICVDLIKSIKVRPIILKYFTPILSSLYQIIYCPIKQPSVENVDGFVMTKDIYEFLLKDRERFKFEFLHLSKSLQKVFYTKETMTFFKENVPKWLKIAVKNNLNNILCGREGIKIITLAVFENVLNSDNDNDVTKHWKTFDVLVKLIFQFYNKPIFTENICDQIKDLICFKPDGNERLAILESLFCLCVKTLYIKDKEFCEKYLIPSLHKNLFDLNDCAENEIVTDKIEQSIRLLSVCFTGKSFQTPNLPEVLLTPIINVLMNVYSCSIDSSYNKIRIECEDLILKYLKCCNNLNELYDNFLFDFPLRNVNQIKVNFEFNVQITTQKDFNNFKKKLNSLVKLSRKMDVISSALFLYLFEILKNKKVYFDESKNDLLQFEDEFILTKETERKLIIYETLSELTGDESLMQNILSENTKNVIDYLESSLISFYDKQIHKLNQDDEDFQILFTTVMVLRVIIANLPKERIVDYEHLIDTIERLLNETNYGELKELLNEISKTLTGDKIIKRKRCKADNELDKALKNVSDPLLPMRGHGLMELTKLIEHKDEETMKRKMYVLNILRENLSDADSYLYLPAISGLAAMGDVFPDTVIGILTDEYSDFSRNFTDDRVEIRMKLGEILVRVTKKLGEIAPKYKSLLINTFLVGAKDDDHLIRASSLSNLGEVCGVLGYKLGSIVIEILVCVHAIIATDKAVEARRAAVTVIRQLLVGLEDEMMIFLKDHILEIYRTLKRIYSEDRDDVMRLQAQLALEELNDNVEKFLTKTPVLNFDKKPVVMKNKIELL